MSEKSQNFEKTIGIGLRIGVSLAIFFMVLGFIWLLLSPTQSTTVPHTFLAILLATWQGHPLAIMSLGLLILILTPLLRVILSIINFWMINNYKYVTITSIVLVILMMAIWFGHH